MLELEQEILEPSGISTVNPPKMILKGVLVSKLCGILYHVDESIGIRYVAPLRQHCSVANSMLVHGATVVMPSPVRYYPSQYNDLRSETKIVDAGWSSMIYLVMLFLLSRQITASRTPAGLSRLSRWTFFTQALIDTFTFIIVGVPWYSPIRDLTLGTPKFISFAIVVNARACIPLIAPAALAVVLLVYEMVS
jgi:hypothetical protein